MVTIGSSHKRIASFTFSRSPLRRSAKSASFLPRCRKLIVCLPFLQHDLDRPGDVLKININEEGLGGDDLADALRYLVATKPRTVHVRRLAGF